LSDNWLSTAGKWLWAPVKAVLGPWWERLVEKRAEDTAFRVRMLEAIVQFRVGDFAEKRNIDSDKCIGIAKKVIERFRKEVIESSDLDVISEEFLSRVQEEIQVCGVAVTAWMQLACLGETGEFDPRHAVIVEFTDDAGSQSHGSTMIASLQSAFPFWNLLRLRGPTNARLSPEALQGLSTYTTRNSLPEVRYEIVQQMPALGTLSHENTKVLPNAWRPPSNV
jgi:hypothetical protein